MKNLFIRKVLSKKATSSEVKGAPLNVGSVIVRCTIKNEDGHPVMIVSVPTRQSKKVAIETAKQVRAITSTPITNDQRIRATQLAEKAKSAKSSDVTARFRQIAHAV